MLCMNCMMTCNIRRTWWMVRNCEPIGAMERMVLFPRIRHRGPGLRAPGSYSVLINHALHLYYLFHLWILATAYGIK